MEGQAALVVHGLGGRATWQQLLERTTSHQVRQAVRRREIVRVATGIYALPGLSGERLAAAAARGALCLESAARAHGLSTLRTGTQVQVVVPPGSRPPSAAGVHYRYAPVSRREIERGCTSFLRTVLDCAAVLPLTDALAVADAALRSGRLGQAELITAAEALRGPGRARRLRVVRAADHRADSALESALRARLLQAGIKHFRPQVPVPTGRWGVHVDLGDPDRKVALEAEGYAFHAADRRDFDRDLNRYDELVRIGWVVLRFNWEQVLFRPEWVIAVIRDVLAERRP